MAKTKIEWATDVWNPIVGCSVVSAGCTHCYAMRQAARWRDRPDSVYRGLTRQRAGKGAAWTGAVRLAPEATLTAPLRWRRPRRIFVNSMGDLFHEAVPDDWIDRVFAVMALAPQHLFMVLTKRPERMFEWMQQADADCRLHNATLDVGMDEESACAVSNWLNGWSRWKHAPDDGNPLNGTVSRWPLPNVWLGVSIEDQATAAERLPPLLATPAAGRFVSAEPLLGPVYIYGGDPDPRIGDPKPEVTALGDWWEPGERADAPPHHGVDLVICGGESGPGARPMHPDWARSLRDQCAVAEVPFHFKQWGDVLVGEPVEGDRGARRFQDGHVFEVIGDGHDMLLAEAEDHRGPPQPIWREYWASGAGDLIRRVGKARAGRLLDGRAHDAVPPLPGEDA